MEESGMEPSSLVTQTGWNQHETLLTGKPDETRLELKANKLTLHTFICCLSLVLPLPQHTRTQTYNKEGNKGDRSAWGHLPEPSVALCASFELSNIQVRTGKYIYLLCVRAQHWWMTWPVELWWPGDGAPLINRLQGFFPLCAINKRCSSLLFPCHR